MDETDKMIIQAIREGKTYKEIAAVVFKSVDTIKVRVKTIKDDNDCKSLAQLIYKLKDEL